jgi:anaerobic selenocysteine-containing dehydrogenase
VSRSVRELALARLGPEGLIDLGLRLGPYRGMRLSKLRAAPHGIDLGPLTPCLPERLFRERIALAPEAIVSDVPRLEAALEDAPREGELVLIGRRQLRSNNSWMHNAPVLMSGRERCTLLIHPDDAHALGVANGAAVRVRSRVGAITVPAEVSAEIMRGVVSLPHGFGHGRQGVRLAVASAHAGASINDLTDEHAIDALSGNAAFSGVPVSVEPA